MTYDLAPVLDQAQGAILAFTMLFIRTGAVFALLPAIGEFFLPARLKLGLSLALTLVLFPLLQDRFPDMAMPGLPAARLLVAEAVAGLILGLGLRLVLIALQFAGTVIAQSTAIAQIGGPGPFPEPTPALGAMLTLGAMVLALGSGLPVAALRMIAQSYAVFPPGQFPDSALMADWAVGRAAWTFASGTALAATALVLFFAINLAFGAINRAMPSLMVTMVGAPLVSGAGLLLLWFLLPAILSHWHDLLARALANPWAAQP